MPSTSTITTFYEFAPNTVIKSSYVNANFQNFRGHILPINTDSASSSNLSHDLGASDHYWKSSYIQEHFQKEITTGSTPPANSFNSYFKSDGKKYKKNSAAAERAFLDTDLVLEKGDLLVGLGANTLTALTIGANSYVLTADSATVTGMAWKVNAGNPLSTKGDLFCFDTAAARIPAGTDGQILISDTTSSYGLKWINQASATNVFTSNGTFTTPAGTSTKTVYKYTILGAGGGGGGSNGASAVGGGGGAGALAIGTFTGVAASTAITITIGLGGTAGTTAGGTGGTGGSSSIGTPVSITCSGGVGGAGSTSATATGSEGGAGGTVTGSPNILAIDGGRGGRAWSASASFGVAGYGANSIYGNGGSGGTLNVAQGPSVSTGYGSGGGGGFLFTTAGASGRDGLVIIEQLTA